MLGKKVFLLIVLVGHFCQAQITQSTYTLASGYEEVSVGTLDNFGVVGTLTGSLSGGNLSTDIGLTNTPFGTKPIITGQTEIISSDQVRFVWESDAVGVAFYDVEMTTDSNFVFEKLARLDENAREFIQDIQPNLTYYFRVFTVTSTGWAVYSDFVGVATNDLNLELPITALEPPNETNLQIYPNPSSDIFRVNGLSRGKFNYLLLDTNGKIVASGAAYTEGDWEISLQNKVVGTYFLRIEQNATIKTFKLMKK